MTVGWGGFGVMWKKPMALVVVRPTRHTRGFMDEYPDFTLCGFGSGQREALEYCGNHSGREVDKWAACNFTPAPPNKIQTPLIAECPVALECRVSQRVAVGVHDLFIGEVLAVQIDESVLDDQGKLDHGKAQPLAYMGGYYWQLGELLGRFGDWRKGPR